MLDELIRTFESLIPRSEMSEGVADVIQIRPETVGEAVEAVGVAIAAMLGGAQKRVERVEAITTSTDTVLASAVELDQSAQIHKMATERTTAPLLNADEEALRQALIAQKTAELEALHAAKNIEQLTDEQFTTAA